jgi:16S rRNA processing protein RimM
MVSRPEYLNIAQIVTTVGVKGELKVKPLTDDPLRLKDLKEVSCLLATGERIVLHPTAVKARPDGVVVAKFAEFDAPEPAAKLRQAMLQVRLAEAKREPGKVLYVDMLGLSVVDDATDRVLGTVTEVLRASQDILEIKTLEGQEVLLPWVDEFVKEVDLESGMVRVTPIEGFFEE